MDRLKRCVPMLRSRLTEPSTWTAIGGILAAFGFNTESPIWQGISYTGMGIAFLAGIFMPEKKADA